MSSQRSMLLHNGALTACDLSGIVPVYENVPDVASCRAYKWAFMIRNRKQTNQDVQI